MKRIVIAPGLVAVALEHGDLPGEAYTHLLRPGEISWTRNGKVRICIAAAAVEILGDQGRLLGDEKSAVVVAMPGEEILFNACVFDAQGSEVWFGDVSLPADAEKLEDLASSLGEIYLTPELPYRWKGLPKTPLLDPRVRRFTS